MKTAYVVRGCPGSGKSTLVHEMTNRFTEQGLTTLVCSSDNFFVCPECDTYHWSAARLSYAHAWCQDKFLQAVKAGVDAVFVDNTNVTARECKFYVQTAIENNYEVVFLEPQTPWAFDIDELEKRNVHGVPRVGLERMLARWVPDMTVEKALGLDKPGVRTNDEEAASAARRIW